MTIGGHLRRYATKLYPRSALFSTSPQAQPPLNSRPQALPPPLITPSEVAGWVVFGAAWYASIKWVGFHGRNMYQAYNAKKATRSRLEELDRKKDESPEAYPKMLQEEIRTLKLALSRREKMPLWEAEHYEREADVLESKLHEWVEVVDNAPVPQG